jgi:hypothetical protein
MVVVRAFGQRMNENIETLAVQHQPGHDLLEFLGLEDDPELRDRVRVGAVCGKAACTDLCGGVQ